MLGAYNVNGVPCELLIDQEALVWWPRAANTTAKATSDKSANSLSSPIRHIARLSNQEASKRYNNVDGELANRSSGEHTNEIRVKEEQTQRRRKIDFDQIIGVTKIHIKEGRGVLKKRSGGDKNQHETISDETTTTTKSTTEQIDSETKETSESAKSSQHFNKLKIYYVKRNEKKLTGRLLKLKKITLEVLRTEADDDGELATTQQHDTNQSLSSESSSSSTPSASSLSVSNKEPQASNLSQLNGIHELIEQHLELKRRQRPRRLLVFVNPYGGKGKALHLYKSKVRKILELAQIECQLVVTKYANHARDTIEDPIFNLEYFDGIICIGGDGMFAELMNGLLYRFNRDKLLSNELNLINKRLSDKLSIKMEPTELETSKETYPMTDNNQKTALQEETTKIPSTTIKTVEKQQLEQQLAYLRSSLGGIGEQFESPNIPIGVIGAGSTDANLFGFIGTNDAVSATLNIVLGNQIQIDVSSIHSIQDDRLLRFVSTFVAYGYFGDVIRESEKLRWLGPSRYDVTALNSLIKYRNYNGLVRILRSTRDGTPLDLNRCHLNCGLCRQTCNNIYGNNNNGNNDNQDNNNHIQNSLNFNQHSKSGTKKEELMTRKIGDDDFEIIEEKGSFVGVNAAVTACRCPQTRKGFSPGNHLANGCADLILVRSCSRMQYINYLIRTGYTNKSAFDLGYVDAYRCRQFEFIVQQQPLNDMKTSDSVHATDDNATSDYQSKGSTKMSTNDTSIASSRQSSNANSLDSKQFASHQIGHHKLSSLNGRHPTSSTKTKYALTGDENGDSASDELGSSSWNADGEILREQSIRVKVNNKLLRVFGTGEPQPRSRCRKQQTID